MIGHNILQETSEHVAAPGHATQVEEEEVQGREPQAHGKTGNGRNELSLDFLGC